MADKELRKMSRTELIEIIYALQQNEQTIRRENEELTARLDDKQIRIESSGSIAEAALSLNHIFEDAQSAAEQYVMSLADTEGQRDKTLDEARRQAEEIIGDARQDAEGILAEAVRDAEGIVAEAIQDVERILAEAGRDAEGLLGLAREARDKASELMSRAEQGMTEAEQKMAEAEQYRAQFIRGAAAMIKQHPELAAAFEQ